MYSAQNFTIKIYVVADSRFNSIFQVLVSFNISKHLMFIYVVLCCFMLFYVDLLFVYVYTKSDQIKRFHH